MEKVDIIEPVLEDNNKKEEKKLEFCPQCGAPLSEHATTCFLCGKKL